MKKIRRGFVWLFMIWKRMLKKPSYVLLLAAIVTLALSFAIFFQNSGELVRIAIFAENEETQTIFSESEKSTTVIKYEFFDSEEGAREAVTMRGFDAAWIIAGDLSDAAQEFVLRGRPVVKIFQRDDTVFLRLSREKLYATIYPYISKAVYDGFMTEAFPEADREVTDGYYYSQSEARSIIEMKFNNSDQKVSELDLLASPVRGILAVAVFLCAYAATMSFKKDRDGGLFARSPESRLIYIESEYIFISVLNAGIVALLSMWLTGIFTTPGNELLLMLVYMLLCTAFCLVWGELTDNIGAMGALMPILAIVMLVICPVFINLVNIPQIQLLLPPFYYLSALGSADYIWYSFIFVAVSAMLCGLLRLVKSKIFYHK